MPFGHGHIPFDFWSWLLLLLGFPVAIPL